MGCIDEIQRLGFTPETYEECIDLIVKKKNHISDIDWHEICRKYCLPYNADTLRKANGTIFGGAFIAEYFKNKKAAQNSEPDLISKHNTQITTSINKDGSQTSNRLLIMTEEESKDSSFILKAHGFNPCNWKLVSAKNTIRQVVTKDDGVQTLYASYITVRPQDEVNIEGVTAFYDDLVKNYKTPAVEKRHKENSGIMLEIPIFDLHFGKLSYSGDVAEPYNHKRARNNFNYIINDVIRSVRGVKIEKIIFPIGSDFFNSDTYHNTTTAGTYQHNDLSPQQMFNYGVELLIDGISKLSEIAPVEAFCVSGNHDFLTSYHAVCTIWAYFHNNKNITVNRDTSPRKYIEFGNCLIGFTHGDKEKNRIGGIMQVEAKEAWGRTKFREWHSGHLHSEHTEEVNGVIIRNLSSVTGTDTWHHNSGYVGSLKKCQSFLWDKQGGLKNIIITSVK